MVILTGDEDEKTVREAQSWGGRAGEAYDRCYHSACDGLDDLDCAALDRNTDAVAGTPGPLRRCRPARSLL